MLFSTFYKENLNLSISDNQFYECTLCPARSGRKDNIRRHVRNLHSESDDELRAILQKIFENFNKKKNELTEKMSELRDEKTENVVRGIANEFKGNTICVQQPNETNATVSSTNVVRNIATSVIKFVGRSQDIQTCWPEQKNDKEYSQSKQTLSSKRDETSPAKLYLNQIEQKSSCSVPTMDTGTIDSIAEIGVNLPSLEPLNFDPFPDITPLPLLNTNTNLTVYRQLLSPYLKKTENLNEKTLNNASTGNATQAEITAPTLIIDRPPKKMIEKYEIFRK